MGITSNMKLTKLIPDFSCRVVDATILITVAVVHQMQVMFQWLHCLS